MKFKGVKNFGIGEVLGSVIVLGIASFIFAKEFSNSYFLTITGVAILVPVLAVVLRPLLHRGFYNQEVTLDSTTLTIKGKEATRRISIDSIEEFGIVRFGKNSQAIYVKTRSKEERFLVADIYNFIKELKILFTQKKFILTKFSENNIFKNMRKTEYYKVSRDCLDIENIFKK